MPMTAEYCASCGCSEFSHFSPDVPCDADCPPSCEGGHEDDDLSCECGRCEDASWIDEPDQQMCACGCPEDEHDEPVEPVDVDGGEPDGVDGRDDEDRVVCHGCDGCLEFEGVGTQLDLVLEEVEGRDPVAARPPWPVGPSGTIRVRWFEQPLSVVGALVRAGDGSPARIHGIPDRGDPVLLWFAATDDGLEVAITQEDLGPTGAC